MFASGWIGWPLHALAVVLRRTAAALDGLAGVLDPDEAGSHAAAVLRPASADAQLPREGTRERIGAALRRARSQYDALHAAAEPAKSAARRRRAGR